MRTLADVVVPSAAPWAVIASIIGTVIIALLVRRPAVLKPAENAARDRLSQDEDDFNDRISRRLDQVEVQLADSNREVASLTRKVGSLQGDVLRIAGERDAALVRAEEEARARKELARSASQRHLEDQATISTLKSKVEVLSGELMEVREELRALKRRLTSTGELGIPGGLRSTDPPSER